MDEIDVSTHQLCELTCKSLNDKISLEEILTVWHGIGPVVAQQLQIRKGVRLNSFGTFSLSTSLEPVFVISNELTSQFRIKQRPQPNLENIPTSSLNFAQLVNKTNLSREAADRIYGRFMATVGRCISQNRNILINIHRVGEIRISDGELVCQFMPDFLDLFKPKNEQLKNKDFIRNVANKTTSAMIINQKIQKQQQNARTLNDGFNIGGEQMEYRKGKGAGINANRPQSAGRMRERNPITGDDNIRITSGAYRPRSSSGMRGGRPFSATNSNPSIATESLLNSPVSMSPSQQKPNTRTQQNRNNSALNRENLERLNKTAPAKPFDARQLAAKALDSGDIIEKVRAKIVERGGANGIRSIAKLLSIMDDNGDKKLTKDELKFGLRDYGIDLTPTQVEQVFFYFDRDGNGTIDFDEFLIGIKGEMNERRKRFVKMAFDILDKDKSGEITPEEMTSVYDFNWHPEVRAGKMTIKEAAKDFMKQWERTEADGLVTLPEFEDYYKGVSASIDDDDYFELMIRNAWRIAGGTGAAANTANRRVLVTNKDGSQSVQTINNELGMKGKDMNDVRNRLAQQGIDAANVELYGGMDNRDKAKSKSKYNLGGGGERGSTQQQQYSRNTPPMNAWQRTGGDEALPSSRSSTSNNRYRQSEERPQQQPMRSNNNYSSNNYEQAQNDKPQRGAGSKFDPFDSLHAHLYTPPIPLEALCIKLQVSSVSSTPRIPMGAFINRMATLDPNLTRDQLKLLWKAVDPKNIGSVEVSCIHELLTNRFGKDKQSLKSNTNVIERVIKKILERCGEMAGIKGLQRTLAVMDDSGDKKLSKDELKYGLRDYGIDLNLRELDDIFSYFDRDRNGFIDIDEFLIGIRGDLNERRKKMVQMAFNILDRDGSGEVSIDEMLAIYNVDSVPEVQQGKKTRQAAMKDFMAVWDGNHDGTITLPEFEDYYKGVSASIDGDDYFELMIRNAWRIAGGTGAAANTANRRVLVTNKDGSQSVQTINNELGMKGKDMNDVRNRLAQQGIDAANVELYGGMDNRDKAKLQQRPGQSNNNRPPSANRNTRPGNNNNNNNGGGGGHVGAFERHAAAAKLAAAFRGRMGRKQATTELRKVEAERRIQAEEELENNRPKPRSISRPKGKSYIGF
eukprot:gene9178-12377_t